MATKFTQRDFEQADGELLHHLPGAGPLTLLLVLSHSNYSLQKVRRFAHLGDPTPCGCPHRLTLRYTRAVCTQRATTSIL